MIALTIVGTMIAALGSTLGLATGLAQLSEPARLRAQLAKELDLYERVPDSPARDVLAASIERKTFRLACYELITVPPLVILVLYMSAALLVTVIGGAVIYFVDGLETLGVVHLTIASIVMLVMMTLILWFVPRAHLKRQAAFEHYLSDGQ